MIVISDGVRAHSPSRQVGVGMAVMGLHLLLLSAWWTSRPDMRPSRKGVDAVTVTVWLKEPPTLPIEPVKLERPHGVSSAVRSLRRDRDNPARDPASSMGPLAIDGDAAMPTTEIISAPQQKQSGSALNLSLSPEALKFLAAPSLAARSPFQGRLPATVERQIAEAAAQTGTWTEERIDLDHIRLRRGNTCIVLSRPEIAKIDPLSESMRRMPWAATVSQC